MFQTRFSKRCNKWKRCAKLGAEATQRAESWERMREPGYSKKGRLREQSPKQKMAWCFLEIEGHIILLELKCWMAGHRQRDRAEEEGHVAIWGCCWPRLGFRHYPKENEKPLDTFDTESPPVDGFFFFNNINLLSPWKGCRQRANGECVNGKPSAGTQRSHGFSPGILSCASEHSQKPCHHPERECGGEEEASHLLFGMNKFSLVSASKPVRGSRSGLESIAFNS